MELDTNPIKASEPTTGEIVRALRDCSGTFCNECICYISPSLKRCQKAELADRLESQEQKIAEIENFHKEMLKDHKAQVAALTARAEQAKLERDYLKKRTKGYCGVCEYQHSSVADEPCKSCNMFGRNSKWKYRGLPQDGEGK